MTRTIVVALALALLLLACAPSIPATPEFLADREGRIERALDKAAGSRAAVAPNASHGWRSDFTVSRASGQRTCVVSRGRQALTAFLIDMPPARTRHITAITGDGLYPGSTVFLTIDGQRFLGEERLELTGELLAALKSGREGWISWSPWPWGTRIEQEVSLAGFGVAYDKCVAKLEN